MGTYLLHSLQYLKPFLRPHTHHLLPCPFTPPFLIPDLTPFSSPTASGTRTGGLGVHTHAHLHSHTQRPPTPANTPSKHLRTPVILSPQLQQINIHNRQEKSLEVNSLVSVCQRYLSNECCQPGGRLGCGGSLSAGAALPVGAETAISNTSPIPWCSLLRRRQDASQTHAGGFGQVLG